MIFTAEITTSPADNGWAVHRRVLDNVPGSILLEDEQEPLLIIPVEAENPSDAAQFVSGLCLVMELTVVSGTVCLTPPVDDDIDIDFGDDADDDDDESPIESSMVTRIRDWVGRTPEIRQDEDCTSEQRVFA